MQTCLVINGIAIKYFRAVSGVTLPEADSEFPAGTTAEISGWGVTQSGSAYVSDVLRLATVHIDSDEGRFNLH